MPLADIRLWELTMPTYGYRCDKCGKVFEKDMTFAQHQRRPSPPCPKCKSRKVRQLPSQFQVITKKAGVGSRCESCPNLPQCPEPMR